MKPQLVTDLPLGFDERTEMSLTKSNDVVIHHPVMPPMIYDETVMRWVEVNTAEPVKQHFRFIEFNDRRALRGVEAARVEVDQSGEWLWMSRVDIENNIRDFGDHQELQKALLAYGGQP